MPMALNRAPSSTMGLDGNDKILVVDDLSGTMVTGDDISDAMVTVNVDSFPFLELWLVR